jgi:hypothetical protein
LTILVSSILATCPKHSSLLLLTSAIDVHLSIHISQFLITPNVQFPSILLCSIYLP